MMETLTLFLCVGAAVVLTNGLMMFLVAWFVLKGLERIGKAEADRLSKIQQAGIDSANQLLGALKIQKAPSNRFGFGGGSDSGPKGGSA